MKQTVVGLLLGSDGMVSVPSAYSVNETADHFETILEQKGLTVFKRIEHGRNAAGVVLALRPTPVLIWQP